MPHTVIINPSSPTAPASGSLLQRLREGATGLLQHLAASQRERRERQQMAEICDATLRDLGLSRADILAELNKPVWRR